MNIKSDSLNNILKSIGAIAALPLTIFALVKTVVDNPFITLAVALITAIIASIVTVSIWKVKIGDVIIAWLILIVAMLSIFVIWPTTMTVEGTVRYTTGDPINNEKIILIDVYGISHETRTNETGYYRFEKVPNGIYRVTLRENEVEGAAGGLLVRTLSTNLIIPASSATPSPSIPTQPEVSPVEIAVLNVNSEIQADGTIKNTASLSITPLGLGTLQLTSPSTIKLGESSVVRLLIIPDSAVTNLPKVTVTTVSAESPDYALKFSDHLQIYPVMMAELNGVNFEIQSDNHPEKPVTSSMPVEWIWNVKPLSEGKQTLILAISVPVIIDRSRDMVSAQTLKNVPIEIRVEVPATPVPTFTPTPLPPIVQIGEKLVENVSAIFVAIIGLIGVLAGTYVAYLNAKKTKVVKPATGKPKKK